MIKEGDINKHNILTLIRRVAMIPFLKSRIFKEETLEGFGNELVFP